jgi:hypothetical protein
MTLRPGPGDKRESDTSAANKRVRNPNAKRSPEASGLNESGQQPAETAKGSKMRTQYTAAQFRRSERRIRRNARTVVNNFGATMRITASNRILEVLNPMTGKWEMPNRTDGVRRGAMGWIYASGNLSPAVGV